LLNKKQLFIATKNKGKVEEIKFCLGRTDIEVLSFIEIPGIPDIEETGTTFEQNAWLKAKQVYDLVKIPVIADDSGLEAEYLKGAPGVYSSRYAGTDASDEDNCRKLLHELEGVQREKRKARFVCVIAYFDGSEKKFFEGYCEGRINDSKRGTGGFGYDPLFIPDGYDKTYAELDPETKNSISHRGRALRKLTEYLKTEMLP
jgi:XTP/dITP diphosphohydrolase